MKGLILKDLCCFKYGSIVNKIEIKILIKGKGKIISINSIELSN